MEDIRLRISKWMQDRRSMSRDEILAFGRSSALIMELVDVVNNGFITMKTEIKELRAENDNLRVAVDSLMELTESKLRTGLELAPEHSRVMSVCENRQGD